MTAPRENEDILVTLEALMSTMKDMMLLIAQHKEEMFKHSRRQQNLETTPPSQGETSSKASGETTIQKLTRFKKFTPKTFKEAITPNEAEDWLEELEAVLYALRTEEEDKMLCTEFLLQGEARMWWKMQKEKKSGEEHT